MFNVQLSFVIRNFSLYSTNMLAFVVRRLLLTLPIVWIVVTLVFGLIHMVPGDPVAQMLGEGAPVAEIEGSRHDLGLDRHQDRKSTRLNSSHGYISYAVFCLKKKKKQPKCSSVTQYEY